ncbi:MAG: helix-turn-helix domain-containing protein [Ilumatobacteraceae bacterium]
MPPIDTGRLRSAELARRAGVSEAYISQLRSGTKRAKRWTIWKARIAEALDVPLDWIEVKEKQQP